MLELVDEFYFQIQVTKNSSWKTTIIAHKIDKLRLQILEALHIKKTKKNKLKSIKLIFKITTMSWNAFNIFFNIPFSW